jgi:hypothetical protein
VSSPLIDPTHQLYRHAMVSRPAENALSLEHRRRKILNVRIGSSDECIMLANLGRMDQVVLQRSGGQLCGKPLVCRY